MLAPFLGGSTQKWSEGIVFACFGLLIILRPPRISLGPVLNLIFFGLIALALLAFLPARWFLQPAWRTVLVDDFGIRLAGTLAYARNLGRGRSFRLALFSFLPGISVIFSWQIFLQFMKVPTLQNFVPVSVATKAAD